MSKLWPWRTGGISDDMFIRGRIPMTKQEIRVVTIAKGRLTEDAVVVDIGAGTGSISVEAALQVPRGMVYAVEKEEEGVRLIKENAVRFGVENLRVIGGTAPSAFEGIPEADCIFIGGSGGALEDIILACHRKLKCGGRLVINAVTLETLSTAVDRLQVPGWAGFEACALSVSRLNSVGRYHMFQGLNPVFVICAEKREASEG